MCSALINYGVDDDITLAAALLHDVLALWSLTTKANIERMSAK